MNNNQINYIISHALSYANQHNYAKGLAIFYEGLKIEPNNLNLLYNIARTYLELKDFNKAIFFYSKLIYLKADFIQAHFDKAIAYFFTNNFIDGFKEYEYRLNFEIFKKPLPIKYPEKLKEFKNKKVLVFHEQGFGDTINFIAYLKELSKYTKDIDVLVQTPLKKLLQSSFKKYSIIDTISKENYDFVIPLLSIPYIFKYSSFQPKKKYLDIPIQDTHIFKSTYKIEKSNLNIGICWQGTMHNTRDKYRSIDIKQFESFFNLSTKQRIKFYSLQKDIRINDNRVVDIAKDFKSFYDTATAIKSLDLVITVDTSIVHLAGALGVKTFLLLPYLPDFRWGLNSNKSNFYKSVKIFRQEERFNWQKPIDLVKKELYKKLKINNIMLFRSYSGKEENPMMIRIGDFMAYMIIANYFKKIEKKYIVLALTSQLHKKFKAQILFKNLFDEIYIDEKPINITNSIFDPEENGGLWNMTPLLIQKYGNKLLPNINISKSFTDNIFTTKKEYIIFNPLTSAQYNTPRNMDHTFINQFIEKLYKKFKSKLIVITDSNTLVINKKVNIVISDNLYDIFYLISKSFVFIGGDTGFSHFAGIAHVKNIFQLYGTSYPSIHNNSYFNANVNYNTKISKLHNYILKNNKLDDKELNEIILNIKKALR